MKVLAFFIGQQPWSLNVGKSRLFEFSEAVIGE